MIIAVVADDAKFRRQITDLLSGQGHRVQTIPSLAAAIEAVKSARPNVLIVADSGDETEAFLKKLREPADLRRLPVLCVDPKADFSAGVSLLDAGADDVMHRPFQPPIFLARVRTLLRREVWSGEAVEDTLTLLSAGPVELKLVSRQALVMGKPVELTRLEFDLLAFVMKHPDRAFKREELLSAVWNYPGSVETRTLDKHVESLRRKLGASGSLLQTVHGVGYRFSPPVAR